MPWGSATVGIPVTGGERGSRNLSVTSTSTLSTSTLEGAAALRMFLVVGASNNTDIAHELDVDTVAPVDVDLTTVGLAKASGQWSYIKYIDSDESGEFSIIEGDESVPQTWIAQTRDFSYWTLYLSTGDKRLVSGQVDYLDPSVVPVPSSLGGGYLMLLERKRSRLDGVRTLEERPDLDLPDEPRRPGSVHAPASIAESGVFDIVAFWSENPEFTDPDFTGAVKGPIFLVDSLEALPDANFRVFAGVPSAAFHHDPQTGEFSLYVYYTVDFPETPYLNAERASYHDEAPSSDYSSWVQPPGGGKAKGFIACKRFDWDTLLDAFTAPEVEADWSRAVEGELLGRVRIWVPQPTTRLRRRAAELLVAFGATVTRATDPEVEAVSSAEPDPVISPVRRLDRRRGSVQAAPRDRGHGPDPGSAPPTSGGPLHVAGSDFVLFFRGVPDGALSGAADGQGLWRASAMPDDVLMEVEDDDALYTSAHRSTVFGVDYVVTPVDPAGASRDSVAPADTSTGNPADPDPVRVRQRFSAEWWVFGGQFSISGAEALGRVIGDEEDGEHAWQEAWTFI